MQVCLLDLDYNLPVQVRDTALGMNNDDEPESQVGKEFQLHQRVKEGENGSSFAETRPNDLLQRLQRTAPYYKVGWGSCMPCSMVCMEPEHMHTCCTNLITTCLPARY